MQTYRLAWLFACSVFVIVVLMWIMSGHAANEALAKVGISLFFAASLFSILSRTFAPFAVAFAGLVLVGASIYA
jgi:lipoprotein signal peptidase